MTVIAAAALAAAALAATGDAPLRPSPAWIGYVGNQPEADEVSYRGFRAAFARLGPEASARTRFWYRHVPIGDDQRFRDELARAVALAPAVLVTPTGAMARVTAPLASRRTAVVFSSHLDPVTSGIVNSRRRSGPPTTGASFADTLDAKRIELLRELGPGIRHVAVLADPGWPHALDRHVLAAIERDTGLTVTLNLVADPRQLDRVIETARRAGADSWYIPYTYLAYLAEPQIVAKLERLRQPAVFASPHAVASGALISYWQEASFAQDTLARMVWRIVQGEDAAMIPIERPKRFVLEVRGEPNPAGMRVTASLIRRADIVR